MISISEEEYADHVDNNDGICLSCETWTQGEFVEHDAGRVACQTCDEHEVYGAEEALLMDELDLNDS